MARRQHTGAQAVERAFDSGLDLRCVLAAAELRPDEADLVERLRAAGVRVRRSSVNDRRRMSVSTPAPRLLGVSGPDPDAPLEVWLRDDPAPAWLLVDVAYPGNAGYAVRCAEVSGAAGIALAVDYDRAARQKALRASMHAERFLPVSFVSAPEVLERARAAGRRILAVEDCGDRAPWQEDLTRPALFVVGGEEKGLSAEILAGCDAVLRLPMQGFIPSYNLQAAMAMVAGEALRQRGA